MVAMYDVLVRVTEAIIVTTIATAIATLAVQKTNAFLEKRKKNEHTRDEQLAHIRKVFQTHLLSKVAESQDSDYVIVEIDRLLQLSVEYFNVSNPDLHKLVSDFWFLYYKAKNYWFKVHRERIYSGLWAGLPIIRNLLQRKMETKASVEVHKTCYYDLYESLSRILDVETAVWKKIISVDKAILEKVVVEYQCSLWRSMNNSTDQKP